MLMGGGVPGKKIKALCIIPARYDSSRFQGKPLVEINGIPMIKRTYTRVSKSLVIEDIVVATDDNRIFDYCLSENINVVMTSNKCLTGTDRLAEVINRSEYSDYDFYLNIQGDEPIIDQIVIEQLVNEYHKYGDSYTAYGLYKIINKEDEIFSNTIIKVIVNENDDLMYMSRLPIPYSNCELSAVHRMQVPAYGYTFNALKIFASHSKTINEQFEDIELLRFVDCGYKVKMCETGATSISVDVPSDVFKVEKWLDEY